MKNWKTGEGCTKRDVDIAYGALTAVALFTFPPAAIASCGAWLADRNHYPAHNDNNQDNN